MTAALALLVLVLAFRFTYRRGPRAGYVLIAASLLWLALDKSMEGRTLIHLDGDHGLTGADLSGLLGLALGAHQAWPDVVRRTRRLLGSRRRRA